MWILSLILGTAHLFISPAHCSEIDQPNIVFIMADDLGFNDVGYHNPEIRTPNLDTLSREGVRLENYYVQPMCSPTRSQFMSGRYQIHTGLQHSVILVDQPKGLPLDSPTIADKLSEAGYSTYAVGKWHLGYYREEFLPTRRGFDRFFGFYVGQSDHYLHNRCIRGHCGVDLHDDTRTTFTNVRNESGTYSTHLYTRRAVNWISAHDTGKPLFMYLAYQAPHGPLQVPDSYKNQYRKERSTKRKAFASMVTALDEGVGQVVDALKLKGLWNNTLLVFSTDNGGEPQKGGSNYPLRKGKRFWFEGGIRGIGFVASPLLERKSYTNKALIDVSDWFPTFIKLANGTMDGTRDIAGVNQWEAITRDAPSARTEILHGIDPLARVKEPRLTGRNNTFDVRISAAIRVGDYKLVTGPNAKNLQVSQSTPTSTRKRGKTRKLLKSSRKGQLFRISNSAKSLRSRATTSEETETQRPEMDLVKLFNIRKDPLERFDLSLVEPGIVKKLLNKLQEYYETSVPALNPRAKRIRPVDGFWGPQSWENVL